MNPDHVVSIFVANETSFQASPAFQNWMDRMNTDSNYLHRMSIRKLDYELFFSGTEFEDWYFSGEYAKSKWISQNLGNAFRLAVMLKEGGIYMDLDMISINSFEGIVTGGGRVIGREDGTRLNNALLVFPPNDGFILAAINSFVKYFDGYSW